MGLSIETIFSKILKQVQKAMTHSLQVVNFLTDKIRIKLQSRFQMTFAIETAVLGIQFFSKNRKIVLNLP